MKTGFKKLFPLTVLSCFLLAVPAYGANISGSVTEINPGSISGYAVNKDNNEETISVELQLFREGEDTPFEAVLVPAENPVTALSDGTDIGNHGFSYNIDWSLYGEDSYTIKAYIISGDEKIRLSGISSYTNYGPGFISVLPVNTTPAAAPAVQGNSLGVFKTTGYCPCERCCGNNTLTYSGTVPTANHTIAADINVLPIGTKVMIDGIVYTVEDMGSGVDGKVIDIFYQNHEEAYAHGVEYKEVFAIE